MNSFQSSEVNLKEELEFICRESVQVLDEIRGKELLIVGGAGFFGYYPKTGINAGLDRTLWWYHENNETEEA